MSTRLWEDTIILAMRDMQWIHALTNGAPWPSLSMFKLDGTPEETLADLIVSEGQRFMLIEAKSSSAQFKDEWMRQNRTTRQLEFRPKHPYRRLSEILAGRDPHFPGSAAMPWIVMSSVAHLFAYCEPGRSSSGVLVRGYAEACQADPDNPPGQDGMHPYAPMPLVTMNIAGKGAPPPVAFSDVLQNNCGVSASNGNQQTRWPVGLGHTEFMDYIYMLTKDLPDGEMNALVLAPGARFTRIVRRVSDLAAVLGDYRPSWDPAPSDTYSVRRNTLR